MRLLANVLYSDPEDEYINLDIVAARPVRRVPGFMSTFQTTSP